MGPHLEMMARVLGSCFVFKFVFVDREVVNKAQATQPKCPGGALRGAITLVDASSLR